MRQWTSNLTRDTEFILFDDLDGMKIIVLNTYIMIFIFLSVLFRSISKSLKLLDDIGAETCKSSDSRVSFFHSCLELGSISIGLQNSYGRKSGCVDSSMRITGHRCTRDLKCLKRSEKDKEEKNLVITCRIAMAVFDDK